MKFALILPDGAADEPIPALGGRTVLEAAHTPWADTIAASGEIGTVKTVPDACLPGSDVATLSLLGFDPETCYTGRAALEAAGSHLPLAPDDLVVRCNLVTIQDGAMRDFTAGHIAQAHASALIAALNAHFANAPLRFCEGVQYRHLLVMDHAAGFNSTCVPPHDIPDQPVANHLPTGPDADRLKQVMDEARGVLAAHPVNQERTARGEPPATDIWLWGHGAPCTLPRWQDRFGVRVASIAAVDLIRGITHLAGFEAIAVPGATGYLDTDYAAKGRAAVDSLDAYDGVLVHVEAPDEAGHLGDAAAKVAAVERIDAEITGPLLARLRQCDKWRILVAPDHPTPVASRIHTRTPPPYCLAGWQIPASGAPFHETTARQAGPTVAPGHRLIERLFA